MISKKRKIVLDFDDTLVKSSEQIIRILNKKYNLNKNINDLKDWGYRSIYKNITSEEVLEMFGSEEFFEGLELNTGVKFFIETFKDDFEFIICSKGDENNLRNKKVFCEKLFKGTDYTFIPLLSDGKENHNLDKSCIDLSDCIFCVEDNVSAVLSINTLKKILIKNYREVYWNKIPEDSDNIYVINDFYELSAMCYFELKNLKEGILIG